MAQVMRAITVAVLLLGFGHAVAVEPALTDIGSQQQEPAEDADNERMVCKRVKRTGSNRHVRVCKTVAEREREREEARRVLSHPSVCSQGIGCVGG